jgi:carbon monoxide dehydrogenase subunit G
MVTEERTVTISAPPEAVWKVMTDIARWPEWTESVRRAEPLSAAPLGFGSEAKLWVKGGPASTWRVTEFTPNKSFTWESKSRGVHSVASHTLEAQEGSTRVTLAVNISGILASLLSPMIRSVSKRNLEMEAEGLKRRVEAAAIQ